MCGERLRRYDELLLGNVPVARRALDVLIPAPLIIYPDDVRNTLGFRGETVLGPLFDQTYKSLASPRGFVRHITGLVVPDEAWLEAT